jgi:hypothetical protein
MENAIRNAITDKLSDGWKKHATTKIDGEMLLPGNVTLGAILIDAPNGEMFDILIYPKRERLADAPGYVIENKEQVKEAIKELIKLIETSIAGKRRQEQIEQQEARERERTRERRENEAIEILTG